MRINNNRKADMGMGTLIIFIALILVAAVAASVLIATTSKLQNKALDTGKLTTTEVGTSLQAIEVYAQDGRNQSIKYWYQTIKLAAGSEPVRFRDLLLTLSLSDQARDYTYTNDTYTAEVTDNSTNRINITIAKPDCDSVELNRSTANKTTMCWTNDQNYTRASNLNITCRERTYGVSYQIQGTSYKEGYLNKGDVAKLCFVAPRNVNESEDVKISIVPKVGSILVVDTTTPDLMVDKRVSIFP